MKTYVYSIEARDGSQISTGELQCNSLKEAKRVASFRRRMEKLKGRVAHVYLLK